MYIEGEDMIINNIISRKEIKDKDDIATCLGKIVNHYYKDFHGFVIYHPTKNIIANSTSLSFRFENQTKPVIFIDYKK